MKTVMVLHSQGLELAKNTQLHSSSHEIDVLLLSLAPKTIIHVVDGIPRSQTPIFIDCST